MRRDVNRMFDEYERSFPSGTHSLEGVSLCGTKIKICTDDSETRAVFDAAKQAKAEVDGWPAWEARRVTV